MKTKSKPSPYPAVPFHAIRTLSLFSSVIVSGILCYFCYHLKHDGYKLPWTFLVMLAASLLSVIALCITILLHCCSRLSPLFNLIVNIAILIFWSLGLALLVWNMLGTLSHTCSRANWATEDGMMVCRTYKALFSFVVVGWLAQTALVILDIRARRSQNRLGVYNRMDVTREANRDSAGKDVQSRAHEIPYGVDEYQDHDGQSITRRTVPEYDHANGDVRMEHFGYHLPPQQTMYDAGSYAYHDRR